MDVTAYISSGILELYVLGKLSSAEEAEVLANAREYPEVKAELERVELDLEQFDRLHRVDPPRGTLTAILRRIENLSGGNNGIREAIRPGTASWIPWAAFGIATLLATLFIYRSLNADNQVQELQNELEQLRAECAEKEAINTSLLAQLTPYQKPGAQLVTLAGSKLSPDSEAQILYNPNEEVAYLATANLPKAPAGKDYQLWALVNGQPVDLGVFDPATVASSLIEVNFPTGAGAFAVTLEEKGGRPAPNLEQLYLIGNVG